MYFQVDTEEIGNIVKHISSYDILKLESAPPTLEDLFMRHYQEMEVKIMSFLKNAGTHRYWHALYYAGIVSEPLYGLYPLYLSQL